MKINMPKSKLIALVMETYYDVLNDLEREKPVVALENKTYAEQWIEQVIKPEYRKHFYVKEIPWKKGEVYNVAGH